MTTKYRVRQRRWRAAWLLCGALAPLALQAQTVSEVQLRQQERENARREHERERALREQQEAMPDVRLSKPAAIPDRIPRGETPCFPIRDVRLDGEDSERFEWALGAANPPDDPALGQCLGSNGINAVLKRIQNAIVSRGYVTTRVLAAPQDLKLGTLSITLVPGRLRVIRFADGTDPRGTWGNALPARSGDLLNLRDVEQALENLQRIPTVAADIQIVPSEGADAKPGESDLVIAWKQRSRWRGGADAGRLGKRCYRPIAGLGHPLV